MFHAIIDPANESPAEAEARWHRIRTFLEINHEKFGLAEWNEADLDFVVSAIICLPKLIVLAGQIVQLMADDEGRSNQN